MFNKNELKKKATGTITAESHAYFYSVVLELSCIILYLSNSTLRTSIFAKLPITRDYCKGNKTKTSCIFLLCGIGIFLALFYIYLIVPYAPAFLQSSRYIVRASCVKIHRHW